MSTSASSTSFKYETLSISLSDYILSVSLNRPTKLNSISSLMWHEIGALFASINNYNNIRAVILSANGRMFTAGLDLKDAMSMFTPNDEIDVSRRALLMKRIISDFQEAFTAIEKCKVPVISVIHGTCIGGGVDLIAACDIRYATEDATFSIKEVDIGLAADIGTLQRGQKAFANNGLFRQYAYTGETFSSTLALNAGFITKLYKTKEDAMKDALQLAATIASKSPIAIIGSKHLINYSRDHSVSEGLDYTSIWNMSMLQSSDLTEAISSTMEKRNPLYSNL